MTANLSFHSGTRIPRTPHVDVDPDAVRLPGPAREASAGHSFVPTRWSRYASLDALLTVTAMVGFVAAIAASFGMEIAEFDKGDAVPAIATMARAAVPCASAAASL